MKKQKRIDHAKVAAKLKGHYKRCYILVAEQGAHGATAHECLDTLKERYPEIKFSEGSITGNMSRLVDRGFFGLAERLRPSRNGKKSTVYVTAEYGEREPENKWRRVSIALILKVLKNQPYQLFSSNGIWYLELPGQKRQQYGNFEDVLEALGRYVKAREHGRKTS